MLSKDAFGALWLAQSSLLTWEATAAVLPTSSSVALATREDPSPQLEGVHGEVLSWFEK